MTDSVFQTLRGTIARLIDCEETAVTPEARLVEDLGFESIDFLELSMAVSRRYRLKVNARELFLSDYRLLARTGSPEEALRELVRAYPHLTEEELRGMPGGVGRGSFLQVNHLVRYVEFHASGVSREAEEAGNGDPGIPPIASSGR